MQRQVITYEKWPITEFEGHQYHEIDIADGVVDAYADLAKHGKKYPNESWFIVGNLKCNEERIGVQVHCQVNRIGPMFLCVTSINVLNESKGIYKTTERIFKKREIRIADDCFHIQADGFEFKGTPDEIFTHVNLDGIHIELHSLRHNPILKVNCLGYLEFIGVEQYDFALPRMETTGTVSVDTDTWEVNGISWLDRQWGKLPKQMDGNKGMSGLRWTWLNPQLSNGCNLSLGQIINKDADILEKLAVVGMPDGSVIMAKIDPIETLDIWTSPDTGKTYPTKMRVVIPQFGGDMIMEVPYKAQEIKSKIPDLNKYEGSISVTGKMFGEEVTGEGFVEHVGGCW